MTRSVTMITGGFSGFGLHLASRLIDTSDTIVCLLDRKGLDQADGARRLQAMVGTDRLSLVPGVDVSNYASFRDGVLCAFKLGPISGFVNNAGIGEGQTLFTSEQCADRPEEVAAWARTIDIDLTGVVFGCALAIRYGQTGCSVVNVASLAAFRHMNTQPVYSAAKAGVVAFTKAVASSEAAVRKSINFNCICPGFVMTDLVKSGMAVGVLPGWDQLGPMTVEIDLVIEGMCRLLATKANNGQVLIVSPRYGIINADQLRSSKM